MSAGRVQSVAVKLIIDRENEINNFTPEEYWSIETEFTHNGETFTAKFYGVDGKKKELKSREDVDQILKQLNGKDFTVDQVNKRERRRNPSSPFTTSSLQQEAFRKLNFRAKKTMMIAQQLYEGIDLGGREGTTGLITYMRTDSTRISDTAKQEAATLIQNKYGENYLGKSRAKKSQQKTQDAHEAIRPTVVSKEPLSIKAKLSNDQYKLYKLIWERFVASQMAPAVLDTVTAHLLNNKVEFRASGSQVKFKGFMKVYVEGTDDQKKDEQKLLPELEEGTKSTASQIEPEQHFTQPPPRYTEARLVKTMEEKGIDDHQLMHLP